VNSFLDFLWLIIVSFAFVAYLIILFQIVTDLFRDKEQKGWHKAVWIVFLILFPLLTAVIYLIARGGGMAERQAAYLQQAKSAGDSYIREVAGRSPAQEIADAKTLLDAGSINADEFEKIKVKALA
jgi:ABC-type dipeptide/oligopeptide/nickel transport system permease subunit